VRVLVLAVVAACGRVGFDASPATSDGTTIDARPVNNGDAGAMAGHDEDGDGLDDVVDPCPHVAGNADDSDGDGVGNGCDPGLGEHAIVLFDAMTNALADPTITVQGPWTQGADHLQLASTQFSAINRTFAIVEADIWIGVTIDLLGVSEDHQIVVHASTGTERPRYYGQLYRTMTVNEQGLVSYDDVTYTTIDSAPLGDEGIPTAALTLLYRARTGGDSEWLTTWPGAGFSSTGPTPSYTGSPRVRFAMGGMHGAVRYTCIIVPI
jgi:hypothetical protein